MLLTVGRRGPGIESALSARRVSHRPAILVAISAAFARRSKIGVDKGAGWGVGSRTRRLERAGANEQEQTHKPRIRPCSVPAGNCPASVGLGTRVIGMQATLTWVDLTTGDRDKMRRVLDLFNEQGTLDEMGLGSLRDALSDALFPGTSYIQTRLRVRAVHPVALPAVGASEDQGRRRGESGAPGGGRPDRAAGRTPGPRRHRRRDGSPLPRAPAELPLLERAHAVGHLCEATESGLVPRALRHARGRQRRHGPRRRSGSRLDQRAALASATARSAGGAFPGRLPSR